VSGEGFTVMFTTRLALARQANLALDKLREDNGGTDPATLADAYDVNPVAFALLVEALVNLGAPVADDMQALARIRPIDELLT
jgi:hypothetical protein